MSIAHTVRRYTNALFTVYLLQAKFHYAILVADRFEAGRRPATSWNLAYHLTSELARASRTSFEHVCVQDSVMEFGFYWSDE